MPRTAISAEAKAAMRANLELEMNARREKLLAMCDAQCASLRSRLERRVNRVPSNKRTTKLIDILEPPIPQQPTQIQKAKETPPPPSLPARRPRPAQAAPAPSHQTATARPAAKPSGKVAAKSVRGTKRVSDDISTDDKENNAELAIPKKRAKAAPASRTRATRAASKKVEPASQVLSPKTHNARPGTQSRTTRRQR